MIELERQNWILSYLERNEFLSLSEAARHLKTSHSTIYRDFDSLAAQNRALRIRGGLKSLNHVPISQPASEAIPFDLREVQLAREKDHIAARAARLLQPNDVVFIDGGTTTSHVAAHLQQFPLRIITISIPLIVALAKRRHELRALDVIVAGGFWDLDLGILLGPDTRTSLAQTHAQWTLLAVDGVSERGITNTNYLSNENKLEMIRNSEKLVVLADHSKIGKNAMTQICTLEKVDILITDEWPENQKILDKIRQANVEVICVPTTGDSLVSASNQANGFAQGL